MVEPQDDLAVRPPPLSLAEAERIIARLEEVVRERHVILVGGQAVTVWATYLGSRLTDGRLARQIVSGDIDFLGNATDVRLAGRLLGGRVRVAGCEDHTPLAGAAMFLDSDGHKRRLDFIENVYGMSGSHSRPTSTCSTATSGNRPT